MRDPGNEVESVENENQSFCMLLCSVVRQCILVERSDSLRLFEETDRWKTKIVLGDL